MGAGKGKQKRVLAKATSTGNGKVAGWWEPDDFVREVEAVQLARILNIHPITATKALKEKFPKYTDYQKYLNPVKGLVRTPEETVEGMTEAGELLAETIHNGEKIAVYGDYDPDGTCGTTTLINALRYYDAADEEHLYLGFANAREGFGLTNDFVKEAHAAGAQVLVTIDCGSTQVEAAQLAKDLGMKVIVVDHHDYDPDNPADFHLNPKKHQEERGDDPNTGAQLAWKLGASVQIAMEGSTREEYWKTPMFLAGVGCRADMAPLNDPENRAFFRVPFHGKDLDVPAGLQELLDHFEENVKYSSMMRTNACMNMPKRTTRAGAADVVKLLSSVDPEEGKKAAQKLIEIYDTAKETKKEMEKQALGDAKKRRSKEKYFTTAVIKGHEEYAGYSGVVAGTLVKEEGKPACVFTEKGKDEFGQKLYKFSLRNGVLNGIKIGADIRTPKGDLKHAGLIHDERVQKATRIKHRNEKGEILEGSSVGGHADVVSGVCSEENIPQVRKVLNKWAEEREGLSKWGWRAKDKGRVYLTARHVAPKDLKIVESEAKLFQPYGNNNYPSTISVEGQIKEIKFDDEMEKYKGKLALKDGSERPVVLHNHELVENVKEKELTETPELEVCFSVTGLDDEEYWIRAWRKV